MGHCSHGTYRPVGNQTRKEAFTGVMGVIERRKWRVLWTRVAVGISWEFPNIHHWNSIFTIVAISAYSLYCYLLLI